MTAPWRDAWTTLVPDPADRHGPLPPLLVVLTVVTGLVDSFSYLALGHVFVANMTGNVVFMAFSLAGAAGFSLPASIVSLLAFVTGALASGRLGQRYPRHRGRLLLAATAVETVLVLAGYLWSVLTANSVGGIGRYVLIVLLGLGMGTQNAAVRRIAVPDLTTTVLTLTITGIAADGRVAGGSNSRIGRRLLSTAAMFVGALLGALLVIHADRALALLTAAVALGATCWAAAVVSRSDRPWTAPV
jgi:uncharacterized membrane protein YoaK (UPF0700 family)